MDPLMSLDPEILNMNLVHVKISRTKIDQHGAKFRYKDKLGVPIEMLFYPLFSE